jgi:ubiquinone/menaquinone biosynthesis C-methylase UbiE
MQQVMAVPIPANQDKAKEIAFFDQHAAADAYNVFTTESNVRLFDTFKRLTGLKPGARVADLGCGSGVFSDLLQRAGFKTIGIDISPKLIAVGKSKFPALELLEGDIENLPFPDKSLDGVLLSGVVHHFPDPRRCVAEVRRVLREGGKFMAFDPNRCNPFMWAYRDRSSPFYSSIGVTENERPVLAGQVRAVFSEAGFAVVTEYLSGLSYRYVASARARRLLSAYNFLDAHLFNLGVLKVLRSFVITSGEKIERSF